MRRVPVIADDRDIGSLANKRRRMDQGIGLMA
jgi:hypothetical protein